MTLFDEIAELGELVTRLRVADDRFRVFGSWLHLYEFRPVLSDAALSAFESDNGIRLPEDYRCFITTVGDGRAGPYYGLDSLSSSARDPSEPFPYVQATDTLSETELESLGDRDEYPGVLEFCHHGCGIYAYLVVNGPTYGTIWEGREDFYPTGLSFTTWYRNWLLRALRRLENEKLVHLLTVGMPKADVISATGGDWKERPAHGPGILYFEAPDIPAQLEIDANGIVVKVKPWSNL